jgi:hypothetical protein
MLVPTAWCLFGLCYLLAPILTVAPPCCIIRQEIPCERP